MIEIGKTYKATLYNGHYCFVRLERITSQTYYCFDINRRVQLALPIVTTALEEYIKKVGP